MGFYRAANLQLLRTLVAIVHEQSLSATAVVVYALLALLIISYLCVLYRATVVNMRTDIWNLSNQLRVKNEKKPNIHAWQDYGEQF